MKKIFILLVLVSSIVMAQQPGWRTIKNTNINFSGAQYLEMFSNSFGNNVILQNTNGSISFYVMNPSTGQSVTGTPVETSGATLANITGDAYKVYVIYKKDNVIKCKYTTNSGTNWSTISNLGINPTTLDATFSGNKLHISYQLSSLTKYYQFNGTNWVNAFDVSSTETGTNPRIEALTTQNKIYVVYGNGNNAKSREYDVSANSWGDRKTLYSGLSNSNPAGFGVDANYIYLYYSRWEYEPDPGWHYKFYTRTIRKSDYTTVNTWWDMNDTYNIQTTTTADNKVHTAWKYPDIIGDGYGSFSLERGLVHDYFYNNSRSMENIEINYYDDYSNIDISSTYNDLYTIWKLSNSSNLHYRQYDTYPSNPTNLSLTSYNNHPKLTWNKNPDADIDYYRVYKKKGTPNFVSYATVPGYLLEYVDNNETVCTAVPPAQCENEVIAKYVITAEDLSSLESGYSNEVEARLIGGPPEKIGSGNSEVEIYNYELNQNYPNPFNPTTTISYSIQKNGLVTLKVYDILGLEVAELVNEVKETGNYSVTFNASELPSGIYFYTLTSNNFIATKKLILLK